MAIQLVNQWQTSSNENFNCGIYMSGLTVGNTLILAYAVRGDGNDPILSDGWTKLGGGNNFLTGDTSQRLYFAYKVVTSEAETIDINQGLLSSRIYMIVSEYSNVKSVVMRNDLAKIGTDSTVTGLKSEADDVVVYGVTSYYYKTDGGRDQTVTPNDLVKIEGDESTERLACWFDNGSCALEHTFKTCDSTGIDAILECVQLIGIDGGNEPEPEYDEKYAVKSEWLISVADEVRRLTGSTDKLTPEQIESGLKGVSGVVSDGTSVTFGYENDAPVEREESYAITSNDLNQLGKIVQGVANTNSLLRVADMVYWLSRARFIPQAHANTTVEASSTRYTVTVTNN